LYQSRHFSKILLKIQSEFKGFLNLLDIIGRARPNAYHEGWF
jgi:hypothetical protein